MAIINSVVKGSGGSAPAHYIEKSVDENGVLINGSTIINLTGVTNLGSYVLYYAYYQNTNITGTVDLSSLTTISGGSAMNYGFNSCTGITGVDLSSLQTISGSNACSQAFQGCTGITNADLSSLTTISGSSACSGMFRGCTGLTNIAMSSLTTISGGSSCNSMFRDCTGITSFEFTSLTSVTGSGDLTGMFQNTGLTTLSFPALTSTSFGSTTNQFNNMLSGVTGCTVHFPSNLQSVIGSWTSVTGGFGGTNTVVLFDLPATE